MISGRRLPAEQDRLAVVHRVRVVHGGSGQPVPGVAGTLVEPSWAHWRVRQRGASLVLSAAASIRDQMPPATRLLVTVRDPARRARFQAEGRAEVTLRRGQDADVTLSLPPAALSLEVRLQRQNGQPRSGRTVEARTDGLAVSLPEVSTTPGTYRSAPRAWGPEFRPCRIYVDNVQRGQTALDFDLPVTQVRLIVP